jgi:hypothetical protein
MEKASVRAQNLLDIELRTSGETILSLSNGPRLTLNMSPVLGGSIAAEYAV